jgi:hypothetical protein
VLHFLKRMARPVALLVIAAQLLLGLPAMATAQVPAAAGTQAPCADMPASHGLGAKHDGCPCCPDGAGSMKDCLVMCTLAAAVTPSVFVVVVAPSQAPSLVEFPGFLTALSDPPLKPPPIA